MNLITDYQAEFSNQVEKIHVRSVFPAGLVPKTVVYSYITLKEFHEALAVFYNQGLRGQIADILINPTAAPVSYQCKVGETMYLFECEENPVTNE